MVPHGLEDTNEALINMVLALVSDKETIASQTRIINCDRTTKWDKLCSRNWAIVKVGEQKACNE